MRVLFTPYSSLGHFLPVAGLAKVLDEAGHEVKFSVAANFAPEVEASGFEVLPLTVDAIELQASIPELRQPPSLARRDAMRRLFFPEALPQRVLPELQAIAEAWRPDIIISDNNEFAGRVVAEQRGIAHAVVKAAHAYHYEQRLDYVASMDKLRAMAGLPPDPEAEMQFRYLYIVNDLPHFHAEPLPPTTLHVRRDLFDQLPGDVLPDWVASLPAQPTVFATLGTVNNNFPGAFDMILEALRDEPLNLILAVGRDLDPTSFGAQPDNVRIERYIPQSLILPYCDVVVSHAGSGTLMAALHYGLPMVNIPIAADQPENAARAAALGLGLMIRPEERTAANLRAAVRTVLADPSYRQNARRLQTEIEALPDLTQAVGIIERLAVTKQPFKPSPI